MNAENSHPNVKFIIWDTTITKSEPKLSHFSTFLLRVN